MPGGWRSEGCRKFVEVRGGERRVCGGERGVGEREGDDRAAGVGWEIWEIELW